jgi:hypothetical protein
MAEHEEVLDDALSFIAQSKGNREKADELAPKAGNLQRCSASKVCRLKSAAATALRKAAPLFVSPG